MRKLVALSAFLLIACATVSPAQQSAPSTSSTIEKVAEGVYAALQPDDLRFDDANSAIVILDDGVLVVDSQVSPLGARAVIAEIRKLTAKPVRWVVNTHWHGDHVQGNIAYQEAFPEVVILAHHNTHRDFLKRTMPMLEEDRKAAAAWIERASKALQTGEANGQKLTAEQIEGVKARLGRQREALRKLEAVTSFAPPNTMFSGRFYVQRGAAEAVHYAGHTEGDLVVHLPKARVLVTGDLLDDLPFTGHGSPRALVATLDKLDALEWDALIPGHGSVRRGREHLRQVRGLFDAIVTQVDRAVAEKLSLDDTKKRVDVSAFRPYFVTDDASGRYWGFFVGEAVARAYAEATEKK